MYLCLSVCKCNANDPLIFVCCFIFLFLSVFIHLRGPVTLGPRLKDSDFGIWNVHIIPFIGGKSYLAHQYISLGKWPCWTHTPETSTNSAQCVWCSFPLPSAFCWRRTCVTETRIAELFVEFSPCVIGFRDNGTGFPAVPQKPLSPGNGLLCVEWKFLMCGVSLLRSDHGCHCVLVTSLCD